MPIGINLNKAKDISHDIRRNKRAEEFAPLDIQANIPHLAAVAEEKRSLIRTKYEDIQVQIDACSSVDELKQIVETIC